MRIEFDRDTCIGMYQCVDEWERFVKNIDAGKADLAGGNPDPDDPNRFVIEVPSDEEFDAEMAARVCPVDAIEFYDDDGNRIVP